MPDGLHRQYTSIQECKSVVTTPSGGQVLLDQGFYSITGLAWSGRGKVRRVDVSADGGRNWRTARLQAPVLYEVPDALQPRLGLGRQAGAAAEPRRSTRPATCSRATASCARCAARARSITTTRSRPGWCRRAARSRNVQLGVSAALAARCWLRRALRRWPRRSAPSPTRASAAPRRRQELAAWDIDVRARLQGPAAGRGHGRAGPGGLGSASARRATACSARANEVFTPIVGGTGEHDMRSRPRRAPRRRRLPGPHDADEAVDACRRCGTTCTARCRGTRRSRCRPTRSTR